MHICMQYKELQWTVHMLLYISHMKVCSGSDMCEFPISL